MAKRVSVTIFDQMAPGKCKLPRKKVIIRYSKSSQRKVVTPTSSTGSSSLPRLNKGLTPWRKVPKKAKRMIETPNPNPPTDMSSGAARDPEMRLSEELLMVLDALGRYRASHIKPVMKAMKSIIGKGTATAEAKKKTGGKRSVA